MRNFLSKAIAYSILFPLFLILLVFVFLNRHSVTLYLNPLEIGIVPAEFILTLGFIIIIFVIIGALLGGLAVKISSGRHIRALKKQLKTANAVQEKLTTQLAARSAASQNSGQEIIS